MSEIYTIQEHLESTSQGIIYSYSINKQFNSVSQNTGSIPIAGGLKEGYAKLIARLLNEELSLSAVPQIADTKASNINRYTVVKTDVHLPLNIWFIKDGKNLVAGVYIESYSYHIAKLLNDLSTAGSLPSDLVVDDEELSLENKRLLEEFDGMVAGINDLKSRLASNLNISHVAGQVPILGNITVDQMGRIEEDFFATIAKKYTRRERSHRISRWKAFLQRLGIKS